MQHLIFDTKTKKYLTHSQSLQYTDDLTKAKSYDKLLTAQNQAKGLQRREGLDDKRLEVHDVELKPVIRKRRKVLQGQKPW